MVTDRDMKMVKMALDSSPKPKNILNSSDFDSVDHLKQAMGKVALIYGYCIVEIIAK
jgi:hypothetical protein